MDAPLRRADVLLAVLEQLTLAIGRLATNAADIHGEFSKRSLLTGRTVEIELPSGKLAGRCRGIDADGALLVETSAGIDAACREWFHAGSNSVLNVYAVTTCVMS